MGYLKGPTIDQNGNKYWFQDGQLHRLDGPALIKIDGTKKWYQDGYLHRLDGPAVIRADGSECWFKKGRVHRTNGPAVIEKDECRWYINDIQYRNNQSYQGAAKLSDEDMLILVLKYGDIVDK